MRNAECRNSCVPGSRLGMTLIELMVGLAITSMVLGAVAALVTAVASSWEDSGGPQPLRVISFQLANRLRQTVRNAKFVGWCGQKPDSSGMAAFLWLGDTFSPELRQMELCEVGLLEHDISSNAVRLWRVTSGLSASQVVDATCMDDASDVAAFKAQAGATCFNFLPGAADDPLQVIDLKLAAHDIRDAQGNPVGRPSLEYAMVVQRPRTGEKQSEYGTAAVRSPRSAP